MLVDVASMDGVSMSAIQVVLVTVMDDRLVAASRAVGMCMIGMHRMLGPGALIPVIRVPAVGVPAVAIVDVIGMRDRRVSAVVTMRMGMIAMDSVFRNH